MNTRKLLETAFQEFHKSYHLNKDPVFHVHRYQTHADQEVAGLLTALLAYGNVTSILSATDRVLTALGESPHRVILDGNFKGRFKGFYHRFTREEDIEILCHWMRGALIAEGSLEQLYCSSEGSTKQRLSAFVNRLRSHTLPPSLKKKLKARERNLKYLLSDPEDGSACKRLNLYLRWMVRPKDGIDLGVWKRVLPADLIIPLDTHLMKCVRALGWTKSKTANWTVAEAATAELRKLDPEDPVRFDFSLCHLSMEGNEISCYAKPHEKAQKLER